MKKRNKMIAMLLAVAMCGSVLTGCGKKEEEKSQSSSSSSSQESTQQEVASGTGEVSTETAETSGEWRNADIYPLDSDKTFTAVTLKSAVADGTSICSERMEEATGVKIEWSQMTGEQFKLALATKEIPDVIWNESLSKAEAYEYGDAGYFVNFMEYLDIMPNLSAVLEENPEMLELAQNEDGSMYILPNKHITNTADSNLIYYRTDMMKEIGWENPPATTDEFLQYIKELQEHFGATDPDFVAFSGYQKADIGWTGSKFPSYFFAAFGPLVTTTWTVDPDGNVVLGAATEQYRLYLEFMNEVFNSGAFSTNIYTLDATTSQGLAAGNHVGISSAHNGHSLSQFESGNFDLAVMPPLTSEYWDTQHWYMSAGAKISPVYMLSASCEDIETMVKWFDAWYSTVDNPLDEEGTYWGITPWLGKIGTDNVLDEATMTYIEMPHDGIELGTFQNTEGLSAIYNGFEGGVFPYALDINTNLGVKGHGTMDNLWPYAETSPVLTAYAMSTEDNDEYTRIYSDVYAFIGEWNAQFIAGERSIEEYWDDYLKELENMGLKTAMQILQKYYDADVNK